MAHWPYNTRQWATLRASKLRETPSCEPCRAIGRTVRANTVDHRIAISKGGSPFPSLSGLMSMCARCHNTKTAATDKAGGKGAGAQFKGATADGFPVDPSHPAYCEGDTPPKDGGLGAVDRRGSRSRTKFRREF